MNRRAHDLYLIAIILAACIAIPLQDWTSLSNLPHAHLLGVTVLIALALLSHALTVAATVGTHRTATSIAFLPYFAAVLLFPSSAAVAVVCITTFATQLLIHKQPMIKVSFNTAQSTLAIIIAALVFESLGGHHSAPLETTALSFGNMLRFATLALTFFVLNQMFVSMAIALGTGSKFRTVLARMLAPGGANILYDLAVSPTAVMVALLYSYFGWTGLLLGGLPLLMIRHAYLSNMRLQQVNKDLLAVLVKTIETRDPYTSGHSIRVSILARAIAEDMGLSPARVDRIEMTAVVHDIGKVDAVYASIIRKEGALNEAERRIIVTHAAKGAEFLKTLASFNDDVIQGVRHHHERYDGSGYPDGLKGEQIPLPARIIMLCDSIDAMLSDRPYRKALSVDFVRAELVRCAGTQFDPRIVDVILKRNTLERAAALVRPETAKPHLVAASA